MLIWDLNTAIRREKTMQAIKTVQLTKKYKDVTAVDGLDLTARKANICSAGCKGQKNDHN